VIGYRLLPTVLKAYPPEAVVAEKLHAMVALGMANSRMKDFYDLWLRPPVENDPRLAVRCALCLPDSPWARHDLRHLEVRGASSS